jgi:exodeoxyribonuclease VII large subunit
VQAGLRLETLTQALHARMARQLAAGEARVGALGLRLAARKPDLAQRRARLDALAQRLERAGSNLLERRRSRLDALAQHLAHLDPRGVLARGYSITRNAAGEIMRDARTLAPGDGIHVELHQGSVDATVNPHND